MALTQNGIEDIRHYISQIQEQEPALTDLKEVTKFMETDENFKKFARGTNAGVTIETKWKELATLIHDDLYQSLANLDYATKTFLAEQENLNNQNI